MAVVAAAGKVVAGERRLGPQGALAAPGRPQPRSTRALSWQSRAGAARVAVAAASFGSAAEAAPFVATGVDWTVEVTRHTLTMPQVRKRVGQAAGPGGLCCMRPWLCCLQQTAAARACPPALLTL